MVTTYRKTALGQAEIGTRSRRITPRARSALILVDGKRDDAELNKLIVQAEETLQGLLDGGLIEVISTTPAKEDAVEPAPARDKPSPAVEDIDSLRREAVRALNDLLGPGAESLALRLERAADPEELRAALERAVTYIGNARGGGAAVQFANRFLKDPSA